MRVVIASCVFPPEPVMSAQTSFQIAEALAEGGHDVTVIAPFPNRPAGRLHAGFSRRLFHRERHEAGFDVIRCFSTFSRESGMASRLVENLSFGLTASWAALTTRRPDVVYANTWPVLATGLLSVVAGIRGVPVVISVQDLYPESLVTQKRIAPNGPSSRWIRRIDGRIARRSGGVIVISERFAAIYRGDRRVAADRVHVVPNWRSPRERVPEESVGRFRDTLGIPRDAFVVAYGGNIGAAAGVETVIRALSHVEDCEKLVVVIAGDGSRLAACRRVAEPLGPSRVVFRAPWPPEETDVLLSMANVLVLPTSGTQSLVSVPSKAVTYMLAGRPVLALAVSGSDLALLIERSGGGWVVEPDQPELLGAKLRALAQLSPAELARMGEAGRTFALEHLTRDACLPRVLRILQRAAQPRSDER